MRIACCVKYLAARVPRCLTQHATRNTRSGRRNTSRFALASAAARLNAHAMQPPDQLRELFRMQEALDRRNGVNTDDVLNAYVKKNEVNFKRQETGYVEKDHGDSKHH